MEKYRSDISIGRILVAILILGVVLVLFGSFILGNTDALTFAFALFISAIICYAFYHNYLNKVSIDEDGQIIIPGNSVKHNGNFYTTSQNSIPSFYFKLNNISKVKRVKEGPLPFSFQRSYVDNKNKTISIEFKKPLKFKHTLGTGARFGKDKKISKLYVSVASPNKLLDRLRNKEK